MEKLKVNILYNGPQSRTIATLYEAVVLEMGLNIGKPIEYKLFDTTNAANRNFLNIIYPNFNQNFCNATMYLSKGVDTGPHEILYNVRSCGLGPVIPLPFPDGRLNSRGQVLNFPYNEIAYNTAFSGLGNAIVIEATEQGQQGNEGGLFESDIDFGGFLLPAAAAAIFLLFAK